MVTAIGQGSFFIHMADKKTKFTAEDIAHGNDLMRTNFSLFALSINALAKVVITRGVIAHQKHMKVFMAVKHFTDFNQDNDPRGEHDFGAVIVDGQRFYFKIDYYDDHFEHRVDPYEQEPSRLLTIMLAEEY